MAEATVTVRTPLVDFRTEPSRYRHWSLRIDGAVATLTLAVDPDGAPAGDYELKRNSYDLGVDVELYDATQRLRFEHPGVKVVVVTSGDDQVFSAGANIRMLAAASHHWKVNFCKFTNETRLAIEEASARSGQRWLAAVNGTASGGGYELALACEHILLVDDGTAAVSLPEVPLLGVLPGTGGLTRLVDKRGVRRDLADVFATKAEGLRGRAALEWRLVDELAPRSRWDEAVARCSAALAAGGDRSGDRGIAWSPLERRVDGERLVYRHVAAELDRRLGVAAIELLGPDAGEPATGDELVDAGAEAWLIAAARELDDLVLHLRTNEPEIGTWTVRVLADADAVLATDALVEREGDWHWLVREAALYWGRVLKRIDVTSRSVFALADGPTCFAGLLLELGLAADRFYMLDGDGPGPVVRFSDANFGRYPMASGWSRLAARVGGDEQALVVARRRVSAPLDARSAHELGVATVTPDDIDWDDELRLALEERASFSPDALTGMEANLRFVGPETLETKIFGRLSAWQNWVFQRPNAVGPEGALPAYGTGRRPVFDRKRV